MKETQGALGMLLRRYRLILGKCRLRNALAGLLLGAVLLSRRFARRQRRQGGPPWTS